jgi:hypothetical protein
VICVILEGKPDIKLPEILGALDKVSQEIDTVFGLDMMPLKDDALPNVEIAGRFIGPTKCENYSWLSRSLFGGEKFTVTHTIHRYGKPEDLKKITDHLLFRQKRERQGRTKLQCF